MSYLRSLHLIILQLVAAIGDCPFFKILIWIIFPTLITADIYDFILKEFEDFLLSIGRINIGIAALIVPT